ncbi:hypothetical protein SLNWT_7083 [Streptomyces albus]|uniref:Uncharacterized protein n=1 Tax=Streptomyces albus (strain ATCC 21838 / DSM 41398 / FERM P-419 / JCM 4703 / NBRC 107858) TaxID=1081613 RepID=A0A0B5F054_STRA4|nr:hypothetical protein SLNWT_7083 [Streptomyces albus]AOU81763.1 hypothetical protein SLNHY_7072 [Streptomyces albus]AYN37451.1 hypothetical protein DUI70_6958 [Streptomyces albus]
MSPEMTVGGLVDLLSGCDRSAPVRGAMNPFFPMVHRFARVVESVDETGRAVVYLAEGPDEDAQLGHLPPEVAIELTWRSPVLAPPRRPRRRVRGN